MGYNDCSCQGNYCGLADADGNCGHLWANCCPNWKDPDGATWAGTGQTTRFRRADGAKDSGKGSGKDSATKILGLDMKQALIAVGVGVAAFLVIKKMK